MKNCVLRTAAAVSAAALLLVCCETAAAQTYYVSSLNGNDGNSGQSPLEAWATVAAACKVLPEMGAGSALLFERGGVYYGSLEVTSAGGTAERPVRFGAYGTGAQPVISGAKRIENWKRTGENVWTARVKDPPASMQVLFVDGRKRYPARFPNSGFRTVTRSRAEGFQDRALDFPEGHWNGATVAYKTHRYYVVRDTVAFSHGDGRVALSGNRPDEKPERGWGYFFQNHVHALDSAGEWVYSRRDGTVTLMQREDPNMQRVEYIDARCGMVIGGDDRACHVLVEGLCFERYGRAGIYGVHGRHLTVRGNTVRQSASGIYVAAFDHCTVQGNTVDDVERNGIELGNVRNTRVHGNVIRCVAMSLDGGQHEGDNCVGILLGIKMNFTPNDSCEIAGNRIDSTGYCGIRAYFSQNLLIKNNVIGNTMLRLADGGGIYMVKTEYDAGLSNNRIIGNIVRNTVGNDAGTPWSDARNPSLKYQYGIYLDDDISGLAVEGNTVAESGRGIFLHGSQDNRIVHNVLFNNALANIAAADSNNGTTFLNNTIRHNRMYGRDALTWDSFFRVSASGLMYDLDFGVSADCIARSNSVDSNYVCAPFHAGKYFAALSGVAVGRAAWSSRTGFDRHSAAAPVSYAASGALLPEEYAILVCNPDTVAASIALDGRYVAFDGTVYHGTVRLQPFESEILFRYGCESCLKEPQVYPRVSFIAAVIFEMRQLLKCCRNLLRSLIL